MADDNTVSPELPVSQEKRIDQLLTLGQVADVLQLSERSVRRLIRSGELHAIRVGGSPRVRMSDLRAFLADAPPYVEFALPEEG